MTTLDISGRDPSSGKVLAVKVRDGVIAEIGPGKAEDDTWLTAGLVDLQVNGFRGHDVNDEAIGVEDVAALVDAELREGVTSFLPTIVTAGEDRILAALEAIRKARETYPEVADAIPCVHVEGPHLSEEDGPRGAHPREHIRPPSLPEFERWQVASGGLVGVVTISPHFAGAASYIAALSSRGVRVAIGHTHATHAEILEAIEAGATLSTHLGNGAHAVLPRHPNYIWSQLADDRLTAMFIADGHHLPAEAFTAMIRAKGVERSILVSDSVGFAGLPPGLYRRPDGAEVRLGPDGRLSLCGTPYLAGAAQSLNRMVAAAPLLGRLSLADAIRMATENPGRILGNRGRLALGCRADIIGFSWAQGEPRLNIRSVIAAGRQIV